MRTLFFAWFLVSLAACPDSGGPDDAPNDAAPDDAADGLTLDAPDPPTDAVADPTSEPEEDASDVGSDAPIDTAGDAALGETCSDSIDIAVLPFEGTGSTAEATDDLEPTGGCPGFWGVESGGTDVVYKFTPTESGRYTVGLPGGIDAGPTIVYLLTDCASVDSSCVGYYDVFEDEEFDGEFFVSLDADTTYYVVVDGFDSFESGPYTLTLDGPCDAVCTGRFCGDDGCGGSCGTCETDKLCSGDGLCVPPEDVEGATCEGPYVIDSLPYFHDGESTTYGDQYAAESCPGIPDGTGLNGPDVVYAFTPAERGVYDIFAAADFDVSVYVVTDCASIGTSCIGAGDAEFGFEYFPVLLEAGTTYLIIVDGTGSSEHGTYEFDIDGPCIPACDGLSCGPDGCGLSCGECGAADDVCDTGMCRTAVTGEICASPIEVSTLPFSASGDTSGSGNEHSPLECADLFGGGTEAADEYYAITLTFDWTYNVTLTPESEWDPVFYVLSSCEPDACLGGTDASGTGEAETGWAVLLGSETYWLVVDGYAEGDEGPYTLAVEELRPDCGRYCAIVTASCFGEDEQYTNEDECLVVCAETLGGTLGSIGDEVGNSLACRTTHAIRSIVDPSSSCANAGPSGGIACL